MSWDYYNWPSDSITTGTDTYKTDNSTTSSGNVWFYGGESSGTAWAWAYPTYRRMLIPRPEGWTKDDEIAFAHLLNKETRTGWEVEMIIDGDVLIMDPDIEVREMDAFIPLLKKRASAEDQQRIDAFFADHPFGSDL